jgi:hypothetical protein
MITVLALEGREIFVIRKSKSREGGIANRAVRRLKGRRGVRCRVCNEIRAEFATKKRYIGDDKSIMRKSVRVFF